MVERQLNGGEALVETLEAFGVDMVFGIPGVHNLTVYEALRKKPSIRHILARHEQGIGFMADGYARISGRVGVGFLISGPGVTNALTPLAGAFAESSPILMIATGLDFDGDPNSRGTLHELKNQFEMAAATCGWAKKVDRADDVSAAVAEAIEHLSKDRPRGAYLQLSLSAMDELTSAPIVQPTVVTGAVGEDADFGKAIELLKTSERPVIMAGSGVAWARAAEELTSVAERLGAPVLLGPKSCDLLPSSSELRYVLPRFHQNPEIESIVSSADVVLVIGTKLGEERTSRAMHDILGSLIRIDLDEVELNNRYEPTVAIRSDAKLALTKLDEALTGEQRAPWADLTPARELQHERLFFKHGDRLDYLDAIRAGLPDSGILVADMTMLGYASSEHYDAVQPYRFLHPYQLCSIGHGFPMAIGASLAAGSDPVVAVCGDGGVLQTITELATAVQEEIPTTFVIFNDQTYSAVKSAQVKQDKDRAVATDLVAPNFKLLAEAMGAVGTHVATPQELETAVRESVGTSRPTVIEVDLPIYH